MARYLGNGRFADVTASALG